VLTGQIRQARYHREVLPAAAFEIFLQQDVDTNATQIGKSEQVARSEGAQDIFENIPAWQPVDQGGRAKQGDAYSQEQP